MKLEAVLLDALPDAVLAVDGRLRVAFANPAAGALLRRSPAETVGTHVGEIFSRLPDLQAAEGDRPVPAAIRLPDGDEVPVDLVAAAAPPALRLLVLRPWTPPTAVPEVAEPMREVLHQAPLAVAVQRGPDLEWELANAAYRDLLGGVELVGRRLVDVLPDWASMSEILREVYATGEPFVASEFPLKVLVRGSETLEIRLFSLRCQPTRDGGGHIDGVSTFALDVTEHIEARREAESLAHEREEALRARDELLSIASHELRTPLTPLILGIQHLRRSLSTRAGASPKDPLAPGLELAERQVKRLQQLVDNLLDVSRIQSDRLALEWVDLELGNLVEEVVERFSFALEESGSPLALVVSGPVWVRGDRFRLDQVISNLLSNAVKYGEARPIEVTIESSADTAVLRVRDHGDGIPPEDRQRIFGRFERGAGARRQEGAGLGLWIVRELVERHGGTVAAQGPGGGGAEIVVKLPRRPEPEAEEA